MAGIFMSNASIDQNRTKTIIGVSSANKLTPTDVAVDPNTLAILVESNEVAPTDPTKNNPSTVLSYDGSGNLQYIDETIGGHVYRTTLSYTSNILTGVSSAVQTS